MYCSVRVLIKILCLLKIRTSNIPVVTTGFAVGDGDFVVVVLMTGVEVDGKVVRRSFVVI